MDGGTGVVWWRFIYTTHHWCVFDDRMGRLLNQDKTNTWHAAKLRGSRLINVVKLRIECVYLMEKEYSIE
jgi:hypothetical protein